LALLALLGGWFVFVRPPVLGGRTEFVFVRGDSMRPSFAPGDLVMTRRQSSYAVGDVVAYHVPGSKARVIHRITAVTDQGYVLQGDNRPTADPWTPTDAAVSGRRVATFAGVGKRIVEFLAHPLLVALASGITAMLVFTFSGEDEEDDEVSERPRRRMRRAATAAVGAR
jgi:signal peptidase I